MADSKITALTAETAPVDADLLAMVDDVAGTPITKKVTFANAAASGPFSSRYAPIARGQFKQTLYTGTTNPTRNTNSYADIDATLFPALSLTLAVGDVVELLLRGTFKHSASGNLTGFDWLIDQPTSADTTIRALGSKAAAWLIEWSSNGLDAQTLMPQAVFVATEAGVHTFKPQWRPFAGTTTMMNTDANYFTTALHRVTNLGPVTA